MGMEITRAVATAGYQVIMACRDPQAAEPKRQLLMRETGNPRIETAPIDLASLASVAAFAEHLLKAGRAVGVADEQCRNHGNGTPHYRRRTGTDGECQLCRALPADPQAAAIEWEEGSRIVNMVSCTYAIGHLYFVFSVGKRGTFGAFLYIATRSWH